MSRGVGLEGLKGLRPFRGEVAFASTSPGSSAKKPCKLQSIKMTCYMARTPVCGDAQIRETLLCVVANFPVCLCQVRNLHHDEEKHPSSGLRQLSLGSPQVSAKAAAKFQIDA